MLSRAIDAVGILGTGSCLPEKVLSNFDLEKMVDTSDEWIKKRTGISERRILDKDTPGYVLGIEASKRAIEKAGITAEDIGLIIATTSTPDYLAPSTSCHIQKGIGAINAAAFDLNAACTGFIYGLSVAKQFVMTGTYKYVLLVACEALTKIVDWADRNTCVLFGDGAGAFVLGAVEEGFGVLDTYLASDGRIGEVITIPCCHIEEKDLEKRVSKEKTLWMDGGEVFKFAVKIVSEATEKVLEKVNLSLDDVDLVVPHQANLRIIDGASRRLKLPQEKMYANIHKYGNISSATIPVAVDEALESGAIKKGDNIVLVGFGGGLTWGSALIKWNK